jgi:hypothetical protein
VSEMPFDGVQLLEHASENIWILPAQNIKTNCR